MVKRNIDSWVSNLYGLPYPIYFYYYSRTELGEDADRVSTIFGHCPSIFSIQLTPFLNRIDFDLSVYSYDVDRLGGIDINRPGLIYVPPVYRVNKIKEEGRVKKIGELKPYKDLGQKPGKGQKRYWRNESKLFNYPYSFAMLTDNLNPPMLVKYELCNPTTNNIKVRNTISDRCSYGIFIEGYKGDKSGSMEAIVSGDAHELPCTSSAYSQWLASNKNTTSTMVNTQIQQAFLQTSQQNNLTNMNNSNIATNQTLNGLTSIMGGIMSGGLVGGLSSMVGVGVNAINTNNQIKMNNLNNAIAKQNIEFNKESAINMTLAKVKDLKSTPNTLLSQGSDVVYGLNKGGFELSLYRYSITTEFATKLADYWALYGYKQNRLMDLNNIIRSRHYYNYVKTIGCNIKKKGRITTESLETIKGIFNKGVTIWHMDRENVVIDDYTYDNYEV